jgi:hypothetical protein
MQSHSYLRMQSQLIQCIRTRFVNPQRHSSVYCFQASSLGFFLKNILLFIDNDKMCTYTSILNVFYVYVVELIYSLKLLKQTIRIIQIYYIKVKMNVRRYRTYVRFAVPFVQKKYSTAVLHTFLFFHLLMYQIQMLICQNKMFTDQFKFLFVWVH